jgi:hypothetical protein
MIEFDLKIYKIKKIKLFFFLGSIYLNIKIKKIFIYL